MTGTQIEADVTLHNKYRANQRRDFLISEAVFFPWIQAAISLLPYPHLNPLSFRLFRHPCHWVLSIRSKAIL